MIFFGINKGDLNVIYMSICFFILFSADMTLTNIEKTIISSISDDNKDFQVDGYSLLSTFYVAFAISIWLAPTFVSALGVRTTMTIGAVLQTLFIFSFAIEKGWLLYVTSVIGGTGIGLIWTASGKYMISNSTPELISRNIGIFWTCFSTAGLFGNIYIYVALKGKKYIDYETRRTIIYAVTGISAFATLSFAFLRPIYREGNKKEINETRKTSPINELQTIWNVFWTKEMLILYTTFCYTGLQQSLAYGIYSPSIGFTLQFGDNAVEFIPISGLLVGIGELIGGFWQTFQGPQLSKMRWGRRIVLISGVSAQILAYALIFINMPAAASFKATNDKSIINSNIYLALLCSLLLGVGDGTLNTQNYSIIAVLFPEQGAHSCALYKFMKAIFVSLGFTMSSHLNLHHLIGVFTLIGIAGTAGFVYVDMTIANSQKRKVEDVEKK